jgi:hypothetical protein
MKYVRTTGFLIDLRRLPEEHRKLFVQAVHEVLRPALDAGAHTGAVPWPRALRVHRIGVNYSMTWSFAGPDGRALFRLAEVAGETVVVWLRVGNHGIYDPDPAGQEAGHDLDTPDPADLGAGLSGRGLVRL